MPPPELATKSEYPAVSSDSGVPGPVGVGTPAAAAAAAFAAGEPSKVTTPQQHEREPPQPPPATAAAEGFTLVF